MALLDVCRPGPEVDENGRFKTGNIGGGRHKGSRNKLGEAFVDDLYADWQENGIAAIAQARADDPAAYLKVIASILPKDLNVNVSIYEKMSTDELAASIEILLADPDIADARKAKVINGSVDRI